MLKNKDHLLLLLANIAAIGFYFAIIGSLTETKTISDTIYSTGDAQEYRDFAKWVGFNSDYCNPVRTYFYPLLVLISSSIAGIKGIWFMHFLMWATAVNLIMIAAFRYSGSRIIAGVSFVFACTNLSCINLTMHALTETTVFFMFALLAYTVAYFRDRYHDRRFYIYLVLIFSVLSAIKPAFILPYTLVLLAVLFITYKKSILNLRLVIFLLLASVPLMVQKVISLTVHHTFSNSGIADYNFRDYYFRKVFYLSENGTLAGFAEMPDSVHKKMTEDINNRESPEMIKYLFSHFSSSASVFRDNLLENLRSAHPYIEHTTHPRLHKWTGNVNDKFFKLHFMMLVVWLLCWIFLGSTKTGFFMMYAVTGGLLFYTFFSTGITFWASDRLVAPSVALWAFFYPSALNEVFKKRFKNAR